MVVYAASLRMSGIRRSELGCDGAVRGIDELRYVRKNNEM